MGTFAAIDASLGLSIAVILAFTAGVYAFAAWILKEFGVHGGHVGWIIRNVIIGATVGVGTAYFTGSFIAGCAVTVIVAPILALIRIYSGK